MPDPALQHPSPAGATATWRQRLREQPLPILGSPAELSQLQGEQVQLPAVLAQAELEPALAIAILCSGHRSPRAEQPRGLRHCIHMLGLGQVQALARPLAAQRLDPRQPGARLALQAMADGRLAGLFALRWLRSALASDEEARQWFAVAMSVARWKLPLIAPEHAAAVEGRVQAGERRARVEHEVWGCDLLDLSMQHLHDLGWKHAPALGAQARLSPALVALAASQGLRSLERREQGDAGSTAMRAPLALCSLADLMAREARLDWFSRRFSSLAAAAACGLGREHEEVLQGLYRQAVFASAETRFRRGIDAPANGLLRPPRPPRSLPDPRRIAWPAPGPEPAATVTATAPDAGSACSTPPGPTPAPVTANPAGGHPASPMERYLQACAEGRLTDLRDLFSAHVGALASLGLTRCALFLGAEGGQLGCYFAHGFEDPAAVRRMRLALAADGLLTRLLSGQLAAFWIQPAQVEGIRQKLPEALREWPPAGGFALAAARHGSRTLGLWWADAGARSEAGLDPARFSGFRSLDTAFGPEFTRLVQAQRERAAVSKPG